MATTTSSPASPAPAAPVRPRLDAVTLSILSAILLAGALVFGNAALARTTARVDLTEEGLFTLSDATTKVLQGLGDEVRLRVYWDEGIPSEASLVQRRLRGLLEEYESASDGRLTVTWVDMSTEAGKKEAQEKGITQSEFQQAEAAKASVSLAYNGLAIEHLDKSATLGPLVEAGYGNYQPAKGLEYEITSILAKWTHTARPVVGLVKESNTPDFMMGRPPPDRFGALEGLLRKQYADDFRSNVDLDQAVPPEVRVLVVLAPKDLPEKQVFHLEQFLLRGGQVALFVDKVGLSDLRGYGGRPKKTGLEAWLGSYGIEIPDGVVGDFSGGAMGSLLNDMGGGLRTLEPYPFVPLLRAPFLNQDIPPMRGLDGVVLTWPSPIKVDEAKQKEAGRTATTLATTSPRGYVLPDIFGLTGEIHTPRPDELSKRTLMAMVEGPFVSFWKGKPSPDEPPPPPPESKPPEKPGTEPAMEGEPGMGEQPAMGETPAMGSEPAPIPPAMEETPPPPPMGEPKPSGPESPPMDGGAGMSSPGDLPPPSGPKGPEGEEGEKGPKDGEKEEGAKEKKDAGPPRLDEGKGRLVILGDAGLVARGDIWGWFWQINGTQGDVLVQNLTDWLAGSEDLISLRARGTKSRILDQVDDGKASAIRWVNFLAAPLLLLMLGLVVFAVRRYRT